MLENNIAIEKKYFDQSISYVEYRSLIDLLLLENKTTGLDQSKEMIEYAKLNQQRMRRLDKNLQLNISLKETISKARKKYTILALTEGWCGDAAQIIPLFSKIENENSNFELRILLRDNHLELMDQFLTNGTRSIPKFLFTETNTRILKSVWGPRPKEAQELLDRLKVENISKSELKTQLHTWYAHDKTQSTQNEIEIIIRTLV